MIRNRIIILISLLLCSCGGDDGSVGIPESPPEPPTFSPPAGIYDVAKDVTITAEQGAGIRYTTDGSAPTSTSGTPYSGPISVPSTTTIKAVASTDRGTSEVATATYKIQVLTPTGNPPPGAYDTDQSVNLICTTTGSQIRYTVDGITIPTKTVGTLFGSSIPVTGTTTIKAIAYNGVLPDSDVAELVYKKQVLTPVFNPSPGKFSANQSVSITCTTSGSSIRYTTDGVTTPSKSVGTLYGGPISVTQKTTIKAIAYNGVLPDSDVASGTFTIMNLAEALDNYGIAPVTGVNASWFYTSWYYYNDGDSAQSGNITPGQSSYLQITFTGSTLDFYWRIIGQEGYDWLILYIDGEQRVYLTGNTYWARSYLTGLGSGPHTAIWYFNRDAGGTGSPYALVDYVRSY